MKHDAAEGLHTMRVNKGLLGWGVFLILAGAIPLAAQAGWISTEQLTGWWNLWPLVLIGIGVGIVLTRTPLEVIGNLIVGGTFGLMLGSFLAVGIGGFPGNFCGGDAGSTPYEGQTGTFNGAADVSLEFNCGELTVSGAPGTAWTFAGTGQADLEPTIEADGDSLRIRPVDRSFVPFNSTRERWQVELPTGVPLGLRVQLNAGTATVSPGSGELRDASVQVNAGTIVADFGGARAIGTISVQTNAGSASLTLPDESLTGRVQVNAGSVEVCTPPDAGVRIRTGGGLGGNNFAQAGLQQTGDTWQSPGFADATTQIELDAEANLGAINLNPDDGCAS